MAEECAVCFEEDRELTPAPCCGKSTTSARFCKPCMDSLQRNKGKCPLCHTRIDTRRRQRQWSAAPTPQQQKYEPPSLPPERPATRKARNNAKRGGSARERQQSHRMTTSADGERLHLSKRSATGYRGVWKDPNNPRYRAEFRQHNLGSFPTAVAATVAYARVARREAYETVPLQGLGPRDITKDESPRVYV